MATLIWTCKLKYYELGVFTKCPLENLKLIYTLEFKEASAKLAAESDQSVSETARELGVGVSTLHAWIQKHYPQKKTVSTLSDPYEKLKALKKELARVKEKRDILKKSHGAYATGHTRSRFC